MAINVPAPPDLMEAFASGARIAQGQAQLHLQQQAMQQKQAQDAIDAAKARKAADFNQMFQMLQLGALERNKSAELALREQEMRNKLGMQDIELMRQGRLDKLAERRVSAYEKSLQARGDSSADALLSTLIGEPTPVAAPVATPAPDAAVPMPEDVGDVAPSSGDLDALDLPDTPGVTDSSLLPEAPSGLFPEGALPTEDLFDEGSEGPMTPSGQSGQPGVPDALLMQDIQGTGAVQGAEPPPSFATSDPGVSRWVRESEDIQTEIRTAAAARQEAASRASQIRALLPRVKDPSLAAKAAAEHSKLARQDAEQQATVQAKEGDLKAARLNAERAKQVQAVMRTLAPLDRVLPAGDMAKLTKSLAGAGDLPANAPPVRQLADLAAYQEVRNTLGMTAPSNGIATAREVVRAYEALQSDDVVQSKNAAALLAALKEGVPTGEFEGGRPVRKKPATTDPAYETWIKNINDLDGKAQAYRSAVTRAEAAMEGDTRRTATRAETPAAQSAPTPTTPATAQEGKLSLATPVPRPAAPPSNVDAWWTAQKQKFSKAARPGYDSNGFPQKHVSLADFDNATLQAIVSDAPMYRLKDGGLTLDPPPDDPRQQAVKDRYVYEEAPWVAVDYIAERFGYDSEETAPGGGEVSNTRNLWADVTIGQVIQEAASEELARRGVNAGGASKPPPMSAEAQAARDKLLKSAAQK